MIKRLLALMWIIPSFVLGFVIMAIAVTGWFVGSPWYWLATGKSFADWLDTNWKWYTPEMGFVWTGCRWCCEQFENND